jgi:hypothetical protein
VALNGVFGIEDILIALGLGVFLFWTLVEVSSHRPTIQPIGQPVDRRAPVKPAILRRVALILALATVGLPFVALSLLFALVYFLWEVISNASLCGRAIGAAVFEWFDDLADRLRGTP